MGNWLANLKHGIGKKSYANGDSYEGLWHNGKAEGPGRCGGAGAAGAAGAVSGEGGLAGWRRSGRGPGLAAQQRRHCCCLLPACACRYVWRNGNQYDGEWRSGKMHGQGTLKWITGKPGAALLARCVGTTGRMTDSAQRQQLTGRRC